jgi:CheY-like chemotaxis protein
MTHKGKILIIDDSPINLAMTKEMLEFSGYEVEVVENALAGIEMMRKNPSHIVLLDILMPQMDDSEVAELIKADEVLKNILLVAFTTFASDENKEKALKSGYCAVVIKPVDLEKLIHIVGSLILNPGATLQILTCAARRQVGFCFAEWDKGSRRHINKR